MPQSKKNIVILKRKIQKEETSAFFEEKKVKRVRKQAAAGVLSVCVWLRN